MNVKILAPQAVLKDGKPAIEFAETTEKYLVASTKSFNNQLDELKRNGKIVADATKDDLFLDRVATEKAVDAFVNEQIKDTETAKMVAEYIKRVLDGGCVYYKEIIRKK